MARLDAQVAKGERPRAQHLAAQVRQELFTGVALVVRQSRPQLGRRIQRRSIAAVLIAHPMAQRDQVDVVVGVQVADADGGEVGRRAVLPEVRERALAKVEQDRRRGVLDEVARRGVTGPSSPGRRTADDGQPHCHTSSIRSTSSASESTTRVPRGGSAVWMTPHGPRRSQTGRMPAAALGRTSLSSRSPT